MSLQAKLFLPALIWIAIGVSAIHTGRRLVQVGYDIDRIKSQINQTRDRNQHLSVQGSKLKSPTRVLPLAEGLGLKLDAASGSSRPGRAPSASPKREDSGRQVHVAERKESSEHSRR